jgi:hypothetical protein
MIAWSSNTAAIERQNFMRDADEESSKGTEPLSSRGDDPASRLIELQAENTRLKQIVTELLVRNQQLRERTRANQPAGQLQGAGSMEAH